MNEIDFFLNSICAHINFVALISSRRNLVNRNRRGQDEKMTTHDQRKISMILLLMLQFLLGPASNIGKRTVDFSSRLSKPLFFVSGILRLHCTDNRRAHMG